MKINSFMAGYQSGGYIFNKSVEKESSEGNLAKQVNDLTLNNQTVSVEEYETNIEEIRRMAIERALFVNKENIKISKNEIGEISVIDKSNSFNKTNSIEEVTKNGLSKDINWKTLNIDLNANFSMSFNNLDRIEHSVEFYASEYASYRTRIESDFTGEEKQSELEKLDQLFNSNIEKLATRFSDEIGGFLNANGVTSENDNIKNSIVDIYNQRTEEYLDFIKENDNYAGLKGTEDEWLKRDGMFMGEQLRFAVASEGSQLSRASENGYTLDDLSAVATLVKETNDIRYKNSSISEEEFGIELGVSAMKYELISQQEGLSDKMKNNLEVSFNNFIDNKVDKANSYLKELRDSPYTKNKYAYTDLNKENILEIVNSMLDNLHSNDINSEFRQDMSTALEMYKSKFNNNLTNKYDRYSSNYSAKSYLEKANNYQSPLKSIESSGIKDVYFDSMRNNLADDWNRFVKRLMPSDGLDKYLLDSNISVLNIKA